MASLLIVAGMLLLHCEPEVELNGGVSGFGKTEIPPAALEVLKNAEKFELLSLFPYPPRERDKKLADDAKHFHRYPILGSTVIEKRETQKATIDALVKAAAAGISPYGCFQPRHGLRATWKGKNVELLICFQCEHMYVSGPGDDYEQVLVTGSAQPVLDEILRAAKVKLADEAVEELRKSKQSQSAKN